MGPDAAYPHSVLWPPSPWGCVSVDNSRRTQSWRVVGQVFAALLRLPIGRPKGWNQWLALVIVVVGGTATGLGLLAAWQVQSLRLGVLAVPLVFFYIVVAAVTCRSSSGRAFMFMGVHLLTAPIFGLFFYPVLSAIGILSCAGGLLGLVFTELYLREAHREEAVRKEEGPSVGGDPTQEPE